ncbi:MAG: DUF3365 domain-containing protein [Sulfurospirillaceae bacterium]|nr:DUF3365 domain-containing protein [Sulfurospirillaceae bacterium]
MIFGITTSMKEQIELSKKTLLQEAIAHFNNMVDTRSWNASFGGVYVDATEDFKPNPYLKDNHIFSSDGKMLIKINPAWMTRLISEISNVSNNYHYKITSLKPLNPNNKTDDFEKESLAYLEKNKSEKYYSKFDDKGFHFMGALKTEESCLQCHAHQGYKVGDIRGGLRVSVPTDIFSEKIASIKQKSIALITFVVLAAFFALILVLYFINTVYKRQQIIEELNENLEKKVEERTRSLESMYENERYLKDVLNLVAKVNEKLITSYSKKEIIENSIKILSEHEYYTFAWIGFAKKEFIDIKHTSTENNSFLSKGVYAFSENINNQIMWAKEALQSKRATVKKMNSSSNTKHLDIKDGINEAIWSISIPFKYDDKGEKNGIIGICSNKYHGFEPEEINMLVNMSADISISINAQRKKEEIERMEIEKTTNYEETILAFVDMIEQRDTYTAGHTVRTAEYCGLIAKEMGISQEDIVILEKAAILHDIGKIATPDAILLKPNRLSALEYELIKQHAEAGYQMLSKIDMYKNLANIIRYHHARYDGKGYPRTSDAEEIPFLSHILILADAFDSITTNRIYKPKKSVEDALTEIKSCSGTQFHPDVVEASLIALKNIEIKSTNQLPTTDLEKKRFSYFFQDGLTGLYNENYLHAFLATGHQKENMLYIHHVELNNFSKYNKESGWDLGNTMLKNIAGFLESEVKDCFIFRYHGDDFIIINNKTLDIKYFTNIIDAITQNTPVTSQMTTYTLDESFDISTLRR